MKEKMVKERNGMEWKGKERYDGIGYDVKG